MGLIVQKFGGTSVADAGKIKAAAQRVAQSFREGNQVVVVVSARGQTTDELFDLANEITDKPSTRELDMLVSTGEQISIALMAMAIHATGLDAISFTGAQVGIVTDSHHTKARILKINTEKIKKELDQGKVVVVAGYQGMDTYDNITSLASCLVAREAFRRPGTLPPWAGAARIQLPWRLRRCLRQTSAISLQMLTAYTLQTPG